MARQVALVGAWSSPGLAIHCLTAGDLGPATGAGGDMEWSGSSPFQPPLGQAGTHIASLRLS